MVLGLYEGSLKITLNGSQFFPGQPITGRVQLQLNESMQARELRLKFYGMAKRGKYRVIVHEVKQQLSGARAYRSGESFDFSITVPADALPPKSEGFLGGLRDYMYSLHPTLWYVSASLDMPNKFDINKRVQVILARAPTTSFIQS